MSHKIFLFFMILMIIVSIWAPPLMADPATDQLCKQPYEFRLGGETYTLSFTQGPFGPGPCGNAVLSGKGIFLTYPFYGDESGLVRVEGLCDFYFAGDELVYIESIFLVLKAQTE